LDVPMQRGSGDGMPKKLISHVTRRNIFDTIGL
jgi:hypothetical protein